MTFDINGKQEDISAMLIGAERYALGRRNYIVSWTCEFIGNNLHLLTKGNRDVMIRDIENAWDMFVARFEGDYWLINGAHEVIEEGVTHWAYLPALPDEE